jgi:hypothetical protein
MNYRNVDYTTIAQIELDPRLGEAERFKLITRLAAAPPRPAPVECRLSFRLPTAKRPAMVRAAGWPAQVRGGRWRRISR